MFSLSATSSQVRVTPRATTRRASSSRGAALVVRAEEKAADAAPAAWTAPKLNPNTPSPIFGGSTGGLLRKAQVRSRSTIFFCGIFSLRERRRNDARRDDGLAMVMGGNDAMYFVRFGKRGRFRCVTRTVSDGCIVS